MTGCPAGATKCDTSAHPDRRSRPPIFGAAAAGRPGWVSPLIACLCLRIGGACVVPSARSMPRLSAPGVHSVSVPAGARAVDASHPSRVVGRGTAASCSSAAVLAAVRAGGIIRFSCGREPVTIKMSATAKVMNTSPQVVIDGGGLVTLSGERRRRILYLDTCDPAQVWTTSHCQDQASPRLVIQNITLADGNSGGQRFDGGGGGAIFARGGRVRIVNSDRRPAGDLLPRGPQARGHWLHPAIKRRPHRTLRIGRLRPSVLGILLAVR
jgi:hypothetical protein